MAIRLPDVSDYQGTVDWQKVLASGCAGGICKATESTTFRAKSFAGNWAALDALGAVRGAYHFARPARTSAIAQADFFLATVAEWKPADLLILDLEDGDGNLDAFALAFLGRVEARTGIIPWFYSYAPFIRAHITDQRLTRYPLWLAAYTAKPPAAPAPWSAWQLWQRTDKAQIPGIKGACDESIGTLPAVPEVQPASVAPTAPVHDFEEATIKSMMLHCGPLDKDGNGWVDWQPGLGRDPIWFSATLWGPSPADDGYWPQQKNVNVSAQPRGGSLRVTVRNGTPGDTVIIMAGVA